MATIGDNRKIRKTQDHPQKKDWMKGVSSRVMGKTNNLIKKLKMAHFPLYFWPKNKLAGFFFENSEFLFLSPQMCVYAAMQE